MKYEESFLGMFIWTLGAIIVGLAICYLFLPLVGVSSLDAMKIMFSGVFAETYTIGNIFVKTAPLILTGLAFAFTFKANLYNIGAQGQFYVGCVCATAISLNLENRLPSIIVILCAMLGAMGGGALLGFLIGFLKAKFKANEFLVSMMSTYVVIYIMKLLLRTVLQESKHEYVQSDSLDSSVWLPKLFKGTSASIGIIISIVSAIVILVILQKTTLGFRIRATGQNVDAARLAGINPGKEFMIAFAISGCLAGLAGFIEVNGMQHMLLADFDSNVGSYGIGIAIMANANPIGVIFSSILFGFLQVGGTVLAHSTSVPTLFVLLSFFFRKKAALHKMKKMALVKEAK